MDRLTINRRMLLTMLAASPFLAAGASADAEVVGGARALLEKAVAADGPGAVVLIARGDRVIFRQARGLANIELGVPLAADQVFEIASITKTFTAALILKLAEQGKLSLEDPLARFLPDFPRAESISVRQLLNHTAGVSDVVKELRPGFGRADLDLTARIADLASRAPDFAPGAEWRYSNGGYLLLGGIVEKVTGKPWHEALRDDLLAPLSLERTQFGQAQRVIAGRVAGYDSKAPGGLANRGFISLSGPASAGGLVSTADDLLAWMRALTQGRAVSAASWREMITVTPQSLPAPFQYGLGVYLWKVRGRAMIGHTGAIPGFASAAAWLPESDLTVIVLANDYAFNGRGNARRLAAIALGEPYVDVAAAARPVPRAMQAALVGDYREDATTVRTLLTKDGELHARRGDRPPLRLVATPDGDLHFTIDELSYFRPVRGAEGEVVRLDYFWDGDGPPRPMPRLKAP